GPQLLIDRPDTAHRAAPRVLRQRTLRDLHARQLAQDRRHLAQRHAEPIVQDMSASHHPVPDPVGRRPRLVRGKLGMLPAHPSAAAPTLAHGHAKLADVRLYHLRQLRDGRPLYPRGDQSPATGRAGAERHRYLNGGPWQGNQLRGRPRAKEPLARFAPWLFGCGHPPAFGERGGWTLALTLEPHHLDLQDLDLCCQLGNVVLLLKDQAYQVVAAQRGTRGRQTHSADCTPAGQLLQVANQLLPIYLCNSIMTPSEHGGLF